MNNTPEPGTIRSIVHKMEKKPTIVLPPNEMCSDHIKMLRDNGFVVVTAKHPESVRFLPPPENDYTAQERACIRLSRLLFSNRMKHVNWGQKEITQAFVELLVEGTPLDQNILDEISVAKRQERDAAVYQARKEEREKIKAEKKARLNSRVANKQ